MHTYLEACYDKAIGPITNFNMQNSEYIFYPFIYLKYLKEAFYKICPIHTN